MAALGALCVPLGAMAHDPDQPVVVPHSMDAMGCMKLRESTDEVYRLHDVRLLNDHFPDEDYSGIRKEANEILDSLRESGVDVYIAAGRYFPRTHRGSYYTDTNTFFLNANHMWNPDVFITVLRHEAWHAAQDCMAGGLDNSFIAVIHDGEQVPEEWQMSARVRYSGSFSNAVPWEQEAIWAGNTEGMTAEAVAVCASEKEMWEVYDPTPMTREWLEDKGHL